MSRRKELVGILLARAKQRYGKARRRALANAHSAARLRAAWQVKDAQEAKTCKS